MPIITVKGPQMSKEKKAEMIHELTKTAAKVHGLPEEAYIVLLEEIRHEDIGFGGKQLPDE